MSTSLEKFSKRSEVSSEPEERIYFSIKLANSSIFQSQNIVTFLFFL